MRAPPRQLLVLHPELSSVDRVAARCPVALHRVADWEALHEAVAAAPPGVMVLVDPYHGALDGGLAPQLEQLLRAFPSATVLALVCGMPGGYGDLRKLSRWGVAELVSLADENTPLALRRRVGAVQSRSVRLILNELAARQPLPARARQILAAAVEVVAAGGLSRDLARAMSVQRNTLLRWCTRSRLPAPRRLLLWIRALHAASLLDDPGHSVESVARACGYSGADALRRGLRAVVPSTPGELRARGALRSVAAAFEKELQVVQRSAPDPVLP